MCDIELSDEIQSQPHSERTVVPWPSTYLLPKSGSLSAMTASFQGIPSCVQCQVDRHQKGSVSQTSTSLEPSEIRVGSTLEEPRE